MQYEVPKKKNLFNRVINHLFLESRDRFAT